MNTIERARDRFLGKPIKIERTGEWECWLWHGALDNKGYACFRGRLYRQKAHRYSYELFVQPIPKGLVIDHLCRRRNCVNPDHLEPVTNEENILRGAHKYFCRRTPRTVCDHGHALTDDSVYINPRGWRHCRACRRNHKKAHRMRQRAKQTQSTAG